VRRWVEFGIVRKRASRGVDLLKIIPHTSAPKPQICMAKKKTTTKEGVAKKQQKPLPQPPLPPLPPLPPVLSRAAQDKIMLPRMTWTESGSTTLAFAAGKMKVGRP